MVDDFAGSLIQAPTDGLNLQAGAAVTGYDTPEADIQIVRQYAEGEKCGIGIAIFNMLSKKVI